MGANLNTLFVVDVEATCWEKDPALAGDDGVQGDRPNEIIEIGVAALDIKSGGVYQRASIGVKPRFTTVSKFCTELTGWAQEDVDRGMDIRDALDDFYREFKPSSNHIWCSFGEYDRYKLSSTTGKPGLLELYGISASTNPFDMMRAHLNIKTLMALKEKLKREMGLQRALEFYKESFQGRHHNGADDAMNIAKIVKRVLS